MARAIDKRRKEAKELGLTRYIGSLCKRGHTERYVNGACVACNSITRFRYKSNKRLQNGQIAKSRHEAIKLGLPRYKAGTACKNGHFSERQTINGRCFECDHEYRAKNRIKLLKCETAYRKNNPEKVKAWKINRRIREVSADGSFTGAELARLFDLQGGRCVYCQASLRKAKHADHIIPISKGGTNFISNIQLTCQRCNNKKYNKHPIEFAQTMGFLL